MQPFIHLTPTPPDTQPNDAAPNQPNIPPVTDFIHNFSNIEWHEDEPTPTSTTQPQMLHLLTIMGQLTVGHYDPTYTWGEHYIAWAPLSETPLQIH